MNQEQLKIIKEICQQNGISYLGLFGSFARGDYTDQSDVDFLVEYSPKSKIKSLFDLTDVEAQFEALLGKKVDLVTKKYLNPNIKDYVYKDLKALYERQ